jgi:hypothetical protein
MGNISTDLEERENVIRAASWRSKNESPEFGDTTYNSFLKVMTYRREVAKRHLQMTDEARAFSCII